MAFIMLFCDTKFLFEHLLICTCFSLKLLFSLDLFPLVNRYREECFHETYGTFDRNEWNTIKIVKLYVQLSLLRYALTDFF